MMAPRTLFACLALLLMAMVPTGSAMAAVMCATEQSDGLMSMPSDNNDDGTMIGDCAWSCVPLCQVLPPADARQPTQHGTIFLVLPSAMQLLFLSISGPEPPPPRLIG